MPYDFTGIVAGFGCFVQLRSKAWKKHWYNHLSQFRDSILYRRDFTADVRTSNRMHYRDCCGFSQDIRNTWNGSYCFASDVCSGAQGIQSSASVIGCSEDFEEITNHFCRICCRWGNHASHAFLEASLLVCRCKDCSTDARIVLQVQGLFWRYKEFIAKSRLLVESVPI